MNRKALEEAAPRSLTVSEIRETIENFHPWRIEEYLEVNKQSAAEVRFRPRSDPILRTEIATREISAGSCQETLLSHMIFFTLATGLSPKRQCCPMFNRVFFRI